MKTKYKVLIIILLVIILVIIPTPFIINAYVINSVKDRIVELDNVTEYNPEAVIILGAGVNSNNQPTPMLKDRLDIGYEVYVKLDGMVPIIVTGDHGQKNYDEVSVMKQYLIDLGVPSEAIFMDHAGFSTYESVYRARDVFEVKKAVIITQEYHLYRTLYISEKLGLDYVGVDSTVNKEHVKSRDHVREFLARNKDFAKTIFKPLPTYLGDTISVSGSGDVTND